MFSARGQPIFSDESPTQFRDVRLSELFAPGKDSLIVDHLMWGPNDKLPCPMCNMWADGYSVDCRCT